MIASGDLEPSKTWQNPLHAKSALKIVELQREVLIISKGKNRFTTCGIPESCSRNYAISLATATSQNTASSCPMRCIYMKISDSTHQLGVPDEPAPPSV